MKKLKFYLLAFLAVVIVKSCDEDDTVAIHKPTTADKATVDRFSSTAGHLMIRTSSNGLPAANTPVNFDQAPFITKGKGPAGQNVEYYNFDVQPVDPAPIYVLFKEGDSSPVTGQLNIIDALPGESGYNDFWQVFKVTVPSNYKANQVASFSEVQKAGYKVEATTTIVNCPVAPEGSIASKRIGGGSASLQTGWYREKIVFYFSFEEKSLTTSGEDVPLSPIYVTFNINPTEPGGGPPSGFVTEPGNSQTHNVVATLPADASYSPLWVVNAYDKANFSSVTDLQTAQAATSVGMDLANVNCPVVTIQ